MSLSIKSIIAILILGHALGANADILVSDKVVGPEQVSLNSATTWVVSDLVIKQGTVIKTNGNSLTIVALGHLVIEVEASIVSFGEAESPTSSPTGPSGANGLGYNPGPGTEGRCPSCPGRDGGPGQNGLAGVPGKDGMSAGEISITVLRGARGNLNIINRGQNGGRGGNGGAGGQGGSGEQGGRGTPNRTLFGIVAGCKAGPGHGGNGGAGGAGGTGGKGGQGGSGGNVSIQIGGIINDITIAVNPTGGMRGTGGNPGNPGQGGVPGYGGRGSTGCEGRETERMGNRGQSGPQGVSLGDGEMGQDGKVSSNIPVNEL